MRLTESENQLVNNKPTYHIDLYDGTLVWCGRPIGDTFEMNPEMDSEIHIDVLDTKRGDKTSFTIHYKSYDRSNHLDDFIKSFIGEVKMSSSKISRCIRRYLANEFGYYELLGDKYKVTWISNFSKVNKSEFFYGFIDSILPDNIQNSSVI